VMARRHFHLTWLVSAGGIRRFHHFYDLCSYFFYYLFCFTMFRMFLLFS
jgi:hypothetical protein